MDKTLVLFDQLNLDSSLRDKLKDIKLSKVKVNEKDGKVIITLYGQEHDITKKVKDGVANVTLYGQDYEVHVSTKKPATAKKIKVTDKSKAQKPEIKFIKLPIKK